MRSIDGAPAMSIRTAAILRNAGFATWAAVVSAWLDNPEIFDSLSRATDTVIDELVFLLAPYDLAWRAVPQADSVAH